MAKAVGFIGTISGKSGNVVFAKGANGATVMRPYQPVVYNPKSSAQSLQRSKMCLAAALSKVCPSDMLVSLSLGRKLANRSFFTKNILRRSQSNYSSQDSNYQATIDAADVVFGRGSETTRVIVSEVALQANSATITLNTQNVSASDLGMVGVRLIAVAANKNGGQSFTGAGFADVVVDAQSASVRATVSLPTLTVEQDYVAVWMVPFRLTDDAAQQYASSAGYETANSVLSVLMASESSTVKSWGDSTLAHDFMKFES